MGRARSSFVVAAAGTTFWGLSGTAAQALFQVYDFPVIGLVTLRMLLSGGLLILLLRPALPRVPRLSFLVLSLFGFAGSQLTYLAAIQFSNAATATLLQFLFLPMVTGYEAVTGALRWSSRWTAVLVLAAAGTILLIGGVTGAGFRILVTPYGLLFGVLSAVTGAYYTLSSRRLVHAADSWSITAWGFIIGGAATLPFGAASLLHYAIPPIPGGTATVALLAGFVVIFGTMLAYGFYLSALKQLSASEVGVVASAEPIAAAAASLAFLGVVMTATQYAGGAMIVVAVVILASRREGGGEDSRFRPGG